MTVSIQATGLRKRYGQVAALDGLDLAVEEGHVVGLLGPNGAGKTTALRILVGLVRADAGSVTIGGDTIDRTWVAGERVGAMVSLPVFYPHLSGTENLHVLAAAWGWSHGRTSASIAKALSLVDLDSVGERPAKGYSTGMRQRLGIALALLADPPILILDEPVNGLDPAGIVEIRDLLIALAADGGRTILLSSHLLTEVEKTCDHVTIVDRGRIVADGTPDSLAGVGERIELHLAPDEVGVARRAIEAAGYSVAEGTEAGALWVDGAPDGTTVSRLLSVAGCYPDELIRRRDSLEDVFLRLTGDQGQDSQATPT